MALLGRGRRRGARLAHHRLRALSNETKVASLQIIRWFPGKSLTFGAMNSGKCTPLSPQVSSLPWYHWSKVMSAFSSTNEIRENSSSYTEIISIPWESSALAETLPERLEQLSLIISSNLMSLTTGCFFDVGAIGCIQIQLYTNHWIFTQILGYIQKWCMNPHDTSITHWWYTHPRHT